MKKILVLLLLVTAYGCANKPGVKMVVECKTPVDINTRGPALVGEGYGLKMTSIPLDALQFTDATIASSVAVQAIRATRSATDTVNVTARIVNCTDKPINVRARTSFMDKNQVPTEPVSAWKILFLSPKATTVYQELSTTDNVSHYLVELGKE